MPSIAERRDVMRKAGRFVVDTHVHPQRHAVRFQKSDDEEKYSRLGELMHTAVPADEADDDDGIIVYDNSERLLYDMDVYGVDMCMLLPAFGMTNEINRQIIEANPEKFVASAYPVQAKKRAMRGEEEWTVDAAVEELEEVLSWDGFIGIGEFLPHDPLLEEPMTWRERKEQLRPFFDVAAAHDVPIRWHPGAASGYQGGGLREQDKLPDFQDPYRAADILAEYPDVTLVFEHGGIQGHWRYNVERACMVAAQYDNVYLEIGLWWKDIMRRPMNDPNIGPSQLLWGTDWGASAVANGHKPDSEHDFPSMRWEQFEDRGIPAHLADYWGTSLRELEKLAKEDNIPQDELNLILGGNFCDIYDVEPPHTRLFPEYLQPE